MSISRTRTLPIYPGNHQDGGELVSECFKKLLLCVRDCAKCQGSREDKDKRLKSFQSLIRLSHFLKINVRGINMYYHALTRVWCSIEGREVVLLERMAFALALKGFNSKGHSEISPNLFWVEWAEDTLSIVEWKRNQPFPAIHCSVEGNVCAVFLM